MGMDGETPSWLEEGGSAAAMPPPVAPDSDAAAAPAAPAKSAPGGSVRDAPPTDNVAGSILASMNAKKKPPGATTTTSAVGTIADAEDNEKLSKLIVFMRVLNMAASVLLITVSVSLPQMPHVFPVMLCYNNITSCTLNYYVPTPLS